MAKKKIKPRIIAIEAPIAITAEEGEGKGPPAFNVVAYTGGALNLDNFEYPVVVDLEGLQLGKSLIANLDHERSQRVGHVTETAKTDGQLTLAGKVSAATDAAREVVESAANGFVWQASIETMPSQLTEVKAGDEIEVNGQKFQGPLYVAAKSTLKGFAFVSHGADDSTSVTIAASAAQQKGSDMDKKLKEWIEAMGFDPEELSADQLAGLTANYEGRQNKPVKAVDLGSGIEAKKAEKERVEVITEIALNACDRRPYDIEAIRKLAEESIEGKWTVEKFRLELLEASLPPAQTVFSPRRDQRLTSRVLEAAVCMTGRLSDHEKMFDDQTLQAAHDRFKRGVGLKQLILLAAEANGYRAGYSQDVTIEAQRAAFGMLGPQQIQAAGFSTISISTILSNVAQKFLREGWMAVDQTPLNISAIRSVRDFKTITTVSLTGDLMYDQVGATGEIKHGTVGEETYSNKADTYARMLAITRQDIINDDVGALTAVPRRLGRGGMLKLNDIFWTIFLDNSAFFTSDRGNANTSTALGSAGLATAETSFMSQTDPDGKPLGAMPQILLVPTALRTTALQLMTSEKVKGSADAPDGNIWQGRFRVESSPYMHNTSYTGYNATAWYLLANPGELPVIEIAALNGNVMPVIESADADFNVLGIQFRGYSDVGVALQEYRGGVRSIA